MPSADAELPMAPSSEPKKIKSGKKSKAHPDGDVTTTKKRHRDGEDDKSVDSGEPRSKKSKKSKKGELSSSLPQDTESGATTSAPAEPQDLDTLTEATGNKLGDGKKKKSKKSKSNAEPEPSEVATKSKKDKKDKKKKSRKDQEPVDSLPDVAMEDQEQQDANPDVVDEGGDVEMTSPGDSKKKDKKRKRKDRGEQADEDKSAGQIADPPSQVDTLPADGSTKTLRVFGAKPDRPYPFFKQTVSQYLPLFPSGLTEPLDGYADQHLKPLLNRYVPTFRGVLLSYRNARLGEAPGAQSLKEDSDIGDEALLESMDEYAVTFGWLTVDVDLFRPSRGAWLEGTVSLQSEGHLGVVCWNMFNASIEAGRLPRGWRWISLLPKNKSTNGDNRAASPSSTHLPTPDPFDDEEEEENGLAQLHTSGYWVDDQGKRIRGVLRFRVKNYEVGVSGEYGYLSIEGTMLDEVAEKAKAEEEKEQSRRRKLRHGGLLRTESKRLPEFSMTKFGATEEEEDESKRAVVWKATNPESETE